MKKEDQPEQRSGGESSGSVSFIPLSAIRPSSSTAKGDSAAPSLDPAAVRARLSGKEGPQFWRSLEELADTDEFREYLHREFPRQAPRDMEPLNRRDFLKFMGASLALAGAVGCAYQTPEKIVPYVKSPE